MVDPEWRFYSDGGPCYPGSTATNYIIDWDQRKWFSVTSSYQQLFDWDFATEMAKRHIDRLDPRVLSFLVSEDGQLETTSAERKDDVTPAVNYPATQPIWPRQVLSVAQSWLRLTA
jgi:hypothetical protein